MDIVFASLGWICFSNNRQYSVVPHCVQGSVFSKRSAIYPPNLRKWIEENPTPELEPDVWDDEVKRELQLAATEGRRTSPSRLEDVGEEWDTDDFWYDDQRY